MPSGRVHDAITLMLAAPVGLGIYWVTSEIPTAFITAGAFISGGMMFGPDLDTVSRQYSRWSLLRPMWWPYRRCFAHRSRFTHGLLFGALFRVIYFMGVISLTLFAGAYLYAAYAGGEFPDLNRIMEAWSSIGDTMRAALGATFYIPIFLGLWLGAASHTFTDIAGSYIKTGRAAKFL